MKRAPLVFALAAVLAVLQLMPAAAAEETTYYMLLGKVYDSSSKEPIKGAEITVGTYNVVSFDDGAYSMRLAEGNYTVKATASGYQTYSGSVSIQGGNAMKDITMKKAASGCVIVGPVALLPLAAMAVAGLRYKRVERV